MVVFFLPKFCAVQAGRLFNIGAGTGAINFNHTSTGYTFASDIGGPGSINQLAGTTILTGDSTGLTGATNVTGGRLAVNGSLVNSIVTVSGGTVGGIVASSGGTVGPGNSIGTLSVNGNLTFAAGSIYQVETNAAGQSDKIAANRQTICSSTSRNLIAGRSDPPTLIASTVASAVEEPGERQKDLPQRPYDQTVSSNERRFDGGLKSSVRPLNFGSSQVEFVLLDILPDRTKRLPSGPQSSSFRCAFDLNS